MMPPRNNGQSSFAVDNASTAEVACPLNNQDGTTCRKRCLGEKRYRSMQEHIRRAHPEYYIPKLPATKESFEQMITTAPHEVLPPENPRPHSSHHSHSHSNSHHLQHAHPSGLSSLALNSDIPFGSSYEGGYNALGSHDGGYYTTSDTEAAMYNPMQLHQPRSPYDEYRRGSIIGTQTAAAVLAGLHNTRTDSEFGGEFAGQVIFPSLQMSPTLTEADLLQSYHADTDFKPNHFSVDPALDEQDYLHDPNFPPPNEPDTHGLPLTDFVRSSSPNRSSSILPPLNRSLSRGGSYAVNRPRKSSLSQQARLPKHERKKSKDLKRRSGEKYAEHRWLDLVEAAASATEEEGSRDLTPVPGSPYASPQVSSRTPLPPFAMGSQFHTSFQASPLNRALTPPPQEQNSLDLQPFPSVDSSLSTNLSHHHNISTDSGSQFQIMHPHSMDSASSPMFTPASRGAPGVGEGSRSIDAGTPQIYCDGCSKPFPITECRACTNCIRGFCDDCQSAILTDRVPNRTHVPACPKCQTTEPAFKPFQLTFRDEKTTKSKAQAKL